MISYLKNLFSETRMKIENLPGNSAVLGGTLKKKCSIFSPLSWDIEWRRPDGTKSPGPILQIDSLKPSDIGKYKCVAFQKDLKGEMISCFDFTVPGS